MVYNSVKYVQIGKKIGHKMIILLVPILAFKKKVYNHVILWRYWYLEYNLIESGICWDCKWYLSHPLPPVTTMNWSQQLERLKDFREVWLFGWSSCTEINTSMFPSGFEAFSTNLSFPLVWKTKDTKQTRCFTLTEKISSICSPDLCPQV